jgi:hypothetical protein
MWQFDVTVSRPEPQPELEEKFRKWLGTIDSLLDVRWVESAAWNAKAETFEGRYALICRWPLADRRYELIRSGELGNEPFDILGWLTRDIHDAESIPQSFDDMENRVVELLARSDNEREDWKSKMKRSVEHNKTLKEKRRKEFLDNEVHDSASYYRNQALGIQQSAVPVEVSEMGKVTNG